MFKRIVAPFLALVIVFSLLSPVAYASSSSAETFKHLVTEFGNFLFPESLYATDYLSWLLDGKSGVDECPSNPGYPHIWHCDTLLGLTTGFFEERCQGCGIYATEYLAELEAAKFSSLDNTTASSGISVTGFSATTVLLSVDNYGPYNAFTNFSKSYPSEFTSLLKSLGIADKVAILSIGYYSPYDLVGVYWDEYGRLTQANFVNPLGVRNASLYGVYSLSDLELISSGLTEVHETDLTGYSTGLFYDKSFAEAQSNFLLGTYVAVDWSSEISYSYFGTSKAPVFRCFFKDSANTVWNSSSRDLGLYQGSSAYWTSYPPSLTGLVWDNSRIIVQPSDTTSASRPVSIMQTINNYNIDNSVTDNSTNVNYYIAPQTYVTNLEDNSIDLDYCYSPTIYDEDTLIFTEPATGAQYQTSGWTYDYTTRTYDISLESGTFTLNDSDIVRIVSTYGDDAATITYYTADDTAVQTDEYAYVVVSGSECSLTGHTYNVETTKDPSCTAPGERVSTCSVCGHQTVEDIPKLEHSFANYTVEKEPTCANHGLAVNTCLTCGSEVAELLDPLGHDWLPTSITDESWVMPDDVSCPDCHGTSFTHTRSDYEIVYGKNLYHIVDGFTSGSSNGVSIDFDPSTMEYTLNGTLTLQSNLFLGLVDPEWLVGEDYTITVFKTDGTAEFASASYSTFAFSLFTRNSDNFVRASSISSEFPDKLSFTCPAIAPSGGDGFIVYLQCWSVGTVFTDFKFKVQIEKGSVATEYEPYTSSEVEIIPPIYNFTCQDCSTEWTAEAVYKHAYISFICARCGETKEQLDGDLVDDSDNWSWLKKWLTEFKEWLGDLISGISVEGDTIYNDYNTSIDISGDTNHDYDITYEDQNGEQMKTSIKELINKFAMVEDIYTIGQTLITAVTTDAAVAYELDNTTSESDYSIMTDGVPTLTVNLGAAESKYGYIYGGKVTVLDLSWYAPYKETVDNLVSGFLWLLFLWHLFKTAPSILGGVGLTTEHLQDISRGEKGHKRGGSKK